MRTNASGASFEWSDGATVKYTGWSVAPTPSVDSCAYMDASGAWHAGACDTPRRAVCLAPACSDSVTIGLQRGKHGILPPVTAALAPVTVGYAPPVPSVALASHVTSWTPVIVYRVTFAELSTLQVRCAGRKGLAALLPRARRRERNALYLA